MEMHYACSITQSHPYPSNRSSPRNHRPFTLYFLIPQSPSDKHCQRKNQSSDYCYSFQMEYCLFGWYEYSSIIASGKNRRRLLMIFGRRFDAFTQMQCLILICTHAVIPSVDHNIISFVTCVVCNVCRYKEVFFWDWNKAGNSNWRRRGGGFQFKEITSLQLVAILTRREMLWQTSHLFLSYFLSREFLQFLSPQHTE